MIRVRWLVALGASVLAAELGAGCSSTDVVLASGPAHGDGGTETRRCVGDEDCRAAEICVRDTCDEVAGHCEARPIGCELTEQLVCGCDGVTYWNDCLRKQAGITASADNSCGPGAAPCGDTAGPCPGGASCARIYPSTTICKKAGPSGAGVCVMLPPTCPPQGSEQVAHCDGPAVGTCEDECSAIRSEKPHYHPNPGQCP